MSQTRGRRFRNKASLEGLAHHIKEVWNRDGKLDSRAALRRPTLAPPPPCPVSRSWDACQTLADNPGPPMRRPAQPGHGRLDAKTFWMSLNEMGVLVSQSVTHPGSKYLTDHNFGRSLGSTAQELVMISDAAPVSLHCRPHPQRWTTRHHHRQSGRSRGRSQVRPFGGTENSPLPEGNIARPSSDACRLGQNRAPGSLIVHIIL